jgi:hypothetical protein
MLSSWHVWSNTCLPLGSRSRLANNRSVNSVPLSVSILLILIGQGAQHLARDEQRMAFIVYAIVRDATNPRQPVIQSMCPIPYMPE